MDFIHACIRYIHRCIYSCMMLVVLVFNCIMGEPDVDFVFVAIQNYVCLCLDFLNLYLHMVFGENERLEFAGDV